MGNWPSARVTVEGQQGMAGMNAHDADSDNPPELEDSPKQTARLRLDAYGVLAQKRSLTKGIIRVRVRRRKRGVDAVGTAIVNARTEVLHELPGPDGPVRIADLGARITYGLLSVLPFFVLTTHARVAVIVGLCVLGACGLLRAWCIALIADRDFLVVRNFLRTYRIAWHDVAEFKDGSTYAGEGDAWALRIHLRNGRVITSHATASLGSVARPAAAATIVRIARQNNIPESLTGDEPRVRQLWLRRR